MASIDKYPLTWGQIYDRIDDLPPGVIYGIPRGGAIAAGITRRAIQDPNRADFILDDIIDSGKTALAWKSRFPDKPFIGLFDKQREPNLKGKWIVFPWEESAEKDGESLIIRLLEMIGEDPNREGLRDTPARVIRSWEKIYGGYRQNPQAIIRAFSEGACDEMIISKGIEFYSICEHHLLPFFGQIAIGYVPDGRILGISKLARIAEIFSRRLQIQERMTAQIADSIEEGLHPKGVMVIVKAKHLCMMSRGVEKQNSEMVTSAIRGIFRDKIEARQEFLDLIR